MKKIISLLFLVLLTSCTMQQEIDYLYRVRLTAVGDATDVDITIKYQDEYSGYRTVELKNQSLPCDYALGMYRGDKWIYASITAKNNNEDSIELTDDGEVRVYIEYDIQKDGQYFIITNGFYDYETGVATCYSQMY